MNNNSQRRLFDTINEMMTSGGMPSVTPKGTSKKGVKVGKGMANMGFKVPGVKSTWQQRGARGQQRRQDELEKLSRGMGVDVLGDTSSFRKGNITIIPDHMRGQRIAGSGGGQDSVPTPGDAENPYAIPTPWGTEPWYGYETSPKPDWLPGDPPPPLVFPYGHPGHPDYKVPDPPIYSPSGIDPTRGGHRLRSGGGLGPQNGSYRFDPRDGKIRGGTERSQGEGKPGPEGLNPFDWDIDDPRWDDPNLNPAEPQEPEVVDPNEPELEPVGPGNVPMGKPGVRPNLVPDGFNPHGPYRPGYDPFEPYGPDDDDQPTGPYKPVRNPWVDPLGTDPTTPNPGDPPDYWQPDWPWPPPPGWIPPEWRTPFKLEPAKPKWPGQKPPPLVIPPQIKPKEIPQVNPPNPDNPTTPLFPVPPIVVNPLTRPRPSKRPRPFTPLGPGFRPPLLRPAPVPARR